MTSFRFSKHSMSKIFNDSKSRKKAWLPHKAQKNSESEEMRGLLPPFFFGDQNACPHSAEEPF